MNILGALYSHIENANEFLRLQKKKETILNNLKEAEESLSDIKEWKISTLNKMLNDVEDEIKKNKIDFLSEIEYLKKALND